MTYTKTRTVRLTDEQVRALEALAAALNISGKGGAGFNPIIAKIADTAILEPKTTAAALNELFSEVGGKLASAGR